MNRAYPPVISNQYKWENEMLREFDPEIMDRVRNEFREKVVKNGFLYEKLAGSKEDKVDDAVEFLIRINYYSWLPEDADKVDEFHGADQKHPETSSEPESQCVLLDIRYIRDLVRSVYCLPNIWCVDGKSPYGSDEDLLLTLGVKYQNSDTSGVQPTPCMYSDNDLGHWLFGCERFLLRSMIDIQNGKAWVSKTFQTPPKLWTLINILQNIVKCVFLDTRVPKNKPISVEDIIETLLENHEAAEAGDQLELRSPLDCRDGGCVSWCMQGVRVLAGLQETTIESMANHCPDPDEIIGEYERIENMDPLCSLMLPSVEVNCDWPPNISPADFDAHYISTGPFKLEITTHLEEHLKVDADGRCVHVFFDDRILPGSTFMIFKGNCMATCFGLHKILNEITLSYSLLFGQSEKGRRILRKMTKRKIRTDRLLMPVNSEGYYNKSFSKDAQRYYSNERAQYISIFQWNDKSLGYFGATASPPSLEDFVIFRSRLQELRQQMDNQLSRNVKDLLKPGYGDRFTWYTQMFVAVISLIGIIGILLAVIQTAYAIVSYNESTELARQGLEIALASLNVSLEALRLQKLQMNITLD